MFFLNQKPKTKKQGFLLLDVLLGMFVLTTVIVLGVIIISTSKDMGMMVASEKTAVFLIQERAEELRNIRDSNLVAVPSPRPWYTGLANETSQITLNNIKFTRNTTVTIGAEYADIIITIEWFQMEELHQIETRKRLYNLTPI